MRRPQADVVIGRDRWTQLRDRAYILPAHLSHPASAAAYMAYV